MFARLFNALLLVLVLHQAHAETFLYFQNNTSFPIEISTSATLSQSYWINQFSAVAEPWRLQTRVLDVNRNVGITNGVDFYLTTKLKINGDSLYLKLKLNGNFVGSDIWCSAQGNGFNHAWFTDFNHHEQQLNIGGKQFILKYQFDTPPGDTYANVYYVLHEVQPYQVPSAELNNPNIINMLTYNVFMLTPPIGSSEELIRASIIHQYVSGYDLIILNEAFYNTARVDELIPNFSQEYPYHTSVVDQSGAVEDGGVMFFSRWPIVDEDQMNYTDCNGSDCFSAKGVMYAKINKLGTPYHIFGTHTQAWNDPSDVTVRLGQLQELYNFMLSKNIPVQEAVLIGGDLNVNKANPDWSIEYTPMLNILNAIEPQYIGHNYTWDVNYNSYASGPEREYLDFIFSEQTHRCAYSSSNKALILRHVESIDALWDNNALDLDLSDHYPVHGRFEYLAFNLQPIAQQTCEGDSFSLSSNVAANVNYQWYMDGVLIPNQTSATLNDVALSNASYHCIASNGCAQISSDTVLISILPSPGPIVISQNGQTLTCNSLQPNIQWYDSNGAIPGASSNTFEPIASGTYYVTHAVGSCQITSQAFEFVLNTSLLNVGGASVMIYPNPVEKGYLYIQTNGLLHAGTWLSIYNIEGKLMQTILVEATSDVLQLNVSSLSAGMYQLVSQHRGQMVSVPFMVK